MKISKSALDKIVSSLVPVNRAQILQNNEKTYSNVTFHLILLWEGCVFEFIGIDSAVWFLDASSYLYKRVCPSVRPSFMPPLISRWCRFESPALTCFVLLLFSLPHVFLFLHLRSMYLTFWFPTACHRSEKSLDMTSETTSSVDAETGEQSKALQNEGSGEKKSNFFHISSVSTSSMLSLISIFRFSLNNLVLSL